MPRNNVYFRAPAELTSDELDRELEDLKRQVDVLLENFPELKTYVPRGFFDPAFHPILDGFRTDEQVAFIRLKQRMAAVSLELSGRSKDSGEPIRVALARSKPEINKRRTVILQNRDTPAPQLCGLLDAANVSLPNGKGWVGVTNWREAYHNSLLRKRIDTIISKEKRRNK